ncbi:esterase OVCA2 isoform X2 [Protopterus annectens]|uniref:esterase OVCA2 isoform X2 n=1 Tax=Protopterus annectens TaxID=7888 RepID=UPI001CFBD6B5|nr:esterase OVCA2 isoform X2 [Protopterus annectens]
MLSCSTFLLLFLSPSPLDLYLKQNKQTKPPGFVLKTEQTDQEPECLTNDAQGDDPRAWWFSSPQEDSFDAMEHSDSCKGLESSLETIAKAMTEQGPFHGILGFSQGAALVAIVCALKQQGDLRFQFDFAMLFAGFKSLSSCHSLYYEKPISVPTLLVFGETDRVIPAAMSEELVPHFVDPVVLRHQLGHFVPTGAAQKKVYIEFLEKFLKKEASVHG